MTEQELRKILREEITDAFQRAGVNLKDPSAAQADALFVRRMRTTAESTSARVTFTGVLALLGLAAALVVDGIRHRLAG